MLIARFGSAGVNNKKKKVGHEFKKRIIPENKFF